MIPHPNQHYRIKIGSARRDYQDGLITAAGLLFYTVGVLRKPGDRISMSTKDWCNLTGLQERTFYKAKAKLIAAGRLEEKIVGTVELWMSEKIAGTIGQCDSSVSCPNGQEDCPNGQEDCPNGQEDCPNGQNEPPKASPDKGSRDSSNNSNNSNKPTKAAEKIFNQIPKDLKTKLEELTILDGTARDKKVLEAINKYDISQVYGAVSHIENTWEVIENPRGVFLFQLPQTPIEKLGSREPVLTAKDFNYTIKDLKRVYGTRWREAAVHHGIEIEDEKND